MSKEATTSPCPIEARVTEIRAKALSYYGSTPHCNVLFVTCGLPRAGKSTWARSLGLPIVDPDAVRLAFYGRPYIKEAEEWVWSMVRCMVRSLFYAGHSTVVVQGCYPQRQQRNQWLANEIWFPVFCVFDTDKATCLRRAEANLRPDLIPVINSMANSFVWPVHEEGPRIYLA